MSDEKEKPMNKTEFISAVAEKSGLPTKEAGIVVKAIGDIIRDELARAGAVSIPNLIKINVIDKPATTSVIKANPFKPGEMMTTKAKPASRVVKVKPLKGLKEMV